MKRLPSVSFLLLAFVATAPATMVIRDFEALRHDRFYVGGDKDFIGDPYDFSGVGSAGGTWATLVSDSFFLSATHFHPAISSSVTFYETDSLSGPSHSYTVMGGQQIGSTDLWVGWFASAVDADIARYPVLDLPNTSDYFGLTQFNYGVSNRVGRNVTEAFGVESVGPSTGAVWYADYDNNDTPSVGGDETFLQGGDSGAPTFNIVGGQLALIGIHWAISDDYPGTNEGELFVDTAVPVYIAAINEVLDTQGQQLLAAPQPGRAVMILAGVLGVALRRRRHCV